MSPAVPASVEVAVRAACVDKKLVERLICCLLFHALLLLLAHILPASQHPAGKELCARGRRRGVQVKCAATMHMRMVCLIDARPILIVLI